MYGARPSSSRARGAWSSISSDTFTPRRSARSSMLCTVARAIEPNSTGRTSPSTRPRFTRLTSSSSLTSPVTCRARSTIRSSSRRRSAGSSSIVLA
jgi:hypothetical protein